MSTTTTRAQASTPVRTGSVLALALLWALPGAAEVAPRARDRFRTAQELVRRAREQAVALRAACRSGPAWRLEVTVHVPSLTERLEEAVAAHRGFVEHLTPSEAVAVAAELDRGIASADRVRTELEALRRELAAAEPRRRAASGSAARAARALRAWAHAHRRIERRLRI